MSKLMEALFPEGHGALVACSAAGEVAACLTAAMSDPRAGDLLHAHAAAEDGFWPAPGHWMSAYRPYVVTDGILQIPVKGVLLADLTVAWGGYATGYVYIRRAFERGLADAGVKGIAFVLNSPGGEVRDNFPLVDRICAGRGTKPIRAFASDHAYSAAYSIASACDRIVVSRTGGVGSIGVVTSHVDASAALEKAGLKITFIAAGKHKTDGNSSEPLSDATKARWQERIDELMSVFVGTVARNRAMSEDAVRATEALTFTASQAVENGLADEIGSLDDAVSAFAAELSTDAQDEQMSDITQAAHDAALATARTEATTSGEAAATARITAILADPRSKGRERAALSLAASSPGMSTEAVLAFVAEHAAAPTPSGGARLDALVPDPKVSATGGEAAPAPDAAAGLAAAVGEEVARDKR